MVWQSSLTLISPSWKFHLFFFFLVACLPYVLCYSTLKVFSPKSLVAAVNAKTSDIDGHIPEKNALFGTAMYGKSMIARVYASDVQDGCDPVNPVGRSRNETNEFFLFLSRGRCTFVTKVLNAQNAGAHGVIVTNIPAPYPGAYGYGDQLIYMAGQNDAIAIPSQLIPQTYGDLLASSLTQDVPVFLIMEFQTPSPDNRTEWELWTSSYTTDARILSFYQTFGEVVNAFGSSALFTPHYITKQPSDLSCSSWSSCNNQCVAAGYCAQQPAGMEKFVTGAAIITEDLRQLCVYNSELAANSQTVGKYWFQYVQLFQSQCVASGNIKFNSACSDGVLTTLANSYSDFKAVNFPWVVNCIKTYDLTDTNNALLLWERDNQTSRFNELPPTLPSLFVNTDQIFSTIVCSQGLTAAQCPIVSAICSGYAPGTKPAACQLDCSFGVTVDACGVCGGNGAIDDCNVCMPRNSTSWNKSCVGNGNSESSSVPVTGIIIGVVVGAIAVFAVLAYFIQRQRNRMKADVNILLQQYVPLAENANAGPAAGRNNTGNSNVNRSVFPPRHNSDPDRASLVAGSATTSEEDL